MDVNFVWQEIKDELNKTEEGNTTSTTTCVDIEENNRIKFNPTMVFSVIGDSDNLVPRPWPKTVFQTALIEAAKSGGGMVSARLEKLVKNKAVVYSIFIVSKIPITCSEFIKAQYISLTLTRFKLF